MDWPLLAILVAVSVVGVTLGFIVGELILERRRRRSVHSNDNEHI